MMPTRRHAWAPVAIVLLGSLTGCSVSTSPAFDSRFGDAVRTMARQQTLDPGASDKNQGLMLKGDGRMVERATERAVDSYRQQNAQPGLSLGNVGTAGNNGGGNAATTGR